MVLITREANGVKGKAEKDSLPKYSAYAYAGILLWGWSKEQAAAHTQNAVAQHEDQMANAKNAELVEEKSGYSKAIPHDDRLRPTDDTPSISPNQ